MLRFRACLVQQVVVPVEVSEIEICVCFGLVRNHPRARRVLSLVVAALLQHLQLSVGISPCAIALGVVIELIGQSDIIITGCDIVRGSGIVGNTETPVVGNLRLSVSAALGGNQDHAGRSLRTIDGTGGCVLEN